MTVKLSPLGDRILVKLIPLEEKVGSIILPGAWAAHITDADGEKHRVSGGRPETSVDAEVLAVGPEVRDIEPGMKVKVSLLAALAEVGDARLYAESSVLAVV